MKVLVSKNRLAAFFAGVVALALLVASFYGTDAEVYLFPRITAVFITVLALILGYDAFKEEISSDKPRPALVDWKTLLPGLAVGIIYVLSLEKVGFYSSSFIAFFMICSIYGKRSSLDPKAFILKLAVTALSMTVLYILFWKLLNVRTPTGILF